MFIAAPRFICAFLIYIRQKKVPIQLLLGRAPLKAAAGISCECSEQQFQIFVTKGTLRHASGPCFFMYSFRECFQLGPIRCAQLQLSWIFLHASEALRSWFFRMKKGVCVLPGIFLTFAGIIFNNKEFDSYCKHSKTIKQNFHCMSLFFFGGAVTIEFSSVGGFLGVIFLSAVTMPARLR